MLLISRNFPLVAYIIMRHFFLDRVTWSEAVTLLRYSIRDIFNMHFIWYWAAFLSFVMVFIGSELEDLLLLFYM